MFVKSRASAQEENKREISHKEQDMNLENPSMVNIGDSRKCPECKTLGRVVWVSQDKKTMGVQCNASHREVSRPESKFGATAVLSTKTKKNVVFLMAVS